MKQKPLTSTSVENQEVYPLPSICIEPLGIQKEKLSFHNLTWSGYRKEGKWKSVLPHFDEEQTYNNVSASFEDLVDNILIKREIIDGSDGYESMTLKNIEDGLILERCDYYFNLKCFCITFSDHLVSYGIQKIKIRIKMESEITIVAPRHYYSFKRKHTYLEAEKGFRYNYVLHYSISKILPLQPNPCSTEMDWNVDPCKLKYINDKTMNLMNCTTPWLLDFARYK